MRDHSDKSASPARQVAGLVALGAIGFSSTACTTPVPNKPGMDFAQSWCNIRDASYNPSAIAFAPWRGNFDMLFASARGEGYHWGGGCWNDNNIDDSPSETPKSLVPRGEGPDCSGLVFKAWGLRTDANVNRGFVQWSDWDFPAHPYGSGAYMGETESWKSIPKANAEYWDVFTNDNHIALVFFENGDGTDQVFEAKGEDYGTNVWTRGYRSDPSYVAARRKGWTG